MYTINPYFKNFYLFYIYIHQRICIFKLVFIFQLANQIWRQISSYRDKKK